MEGKALTGLKRRQIMNVNMADEMRSAMNGLDT